MLPVPTKDQDFASFCAENGLTEINPNSVIRFPYHKGVGAVIFQGHVFVLCAPDVGDLYWLDWATATGEEEAYA